MSNCHVEELSRVYDALFEDVLYAYPAMRVELARDRVRLSECVKRRGIHVYCVDLPAAGKHLDRCLSDGAYKLSGLPMTGRYSNTVVIPKFLRGLYLRVFDAHGNLKGDYDVTAIFFLRQILYAGKKAAIPCSDQAVENEISDFLAVDSTLPEPDSFWSQVAPSTSDVISTYAGFSKSRMYVRRAEESGNPDLSIFLSTLDIVSGVVCSTLGPYSYGEWRFRHGPGAVSNLTSESNKYCWTNWSEELEHAFPFADCGFHNYRSWVGHVEEQRSLKRQSSLGFGAAGKLVLTSDNPASRLIDVPKTLTKPRLIACEPSEHQWCQQNIWHFLGTRAQDSWIRKFVRFRDQTWNQELCKRGSQDGRLVTVDLSAASDRVTCHLVGQLFRVNPPLLLAMRASRTRLIDVTRRDGSVERIELRKFATMGSACTFPVETLAFLCVAISSVLAKRRLRPTLTNIQRLAGEVTIFGDDIIIPEDSRELLFGALDLLHFKVNTSKSFWNGLFRESCGVDSYAGYDVSPAYWRAPYDGTPESYAMTVAVSNNFYRKFLLRTAEYVASTIEAWSESHKGSPHLPPLVQYDSGYCGLKSFVDPSGHRHGNVRWSGGLHRYEVRVPVLIARASKLPSTDETSLLQYFSEEPSPFSFWAAGIAMRPKLKVKLRWVPVQDLSTRVEDLARQQDFMGTDSKSGFLVYHHFKVSRGVT